VSTRARALIGLLALVGLSLGVAFSSQLGYDYPADAGPAISALSHGDIHGWATAQPIMGTFSILLRAPFAALASLGDGGALLVYRLGALPCLMAAGLLGVYLSRRTRQVGASWAVGMALIALCLVNPMTFDALEFGHPEDLLGASLVVAAVLVASLDRPYAAGALLGLALATKQWALIAVFPVVLAAPSRRRHLVAATAVVAGLLLAVPLLADAHRVVSTNVEAAQANTAFDSRPVANPQSVWWPIGSAGPAGTPVHVLPHALNRLPRPLVVVLGVVLALVLVVRRRRSGDAGAVPADDALLLLALVFLVRSAFDAGNLGYYQLPFLFALAGYEALRGKPPIVTAVSSLALWPLFHPPLGTPAAAVNVSYLAFALLLAAYIAARLYAPATLPRLRRRLATSARTQTITSEA
jgi:hypothetical protein